MAKTTNTKAKTNAKASKTTSIKASKTTNNKTKAKTNTKTATTKKKVVKKPVGKTKKVK